MDGAATTGDKDGALNCYQHPLEHLAAGPLNKRAPCPQYNLVRNSAATRGTRTRIFRCAHPLCSTKSPLMGGVRNIWTGSAA